MISSGEIHRILNMAQSLGASYIRSGVTYTVSFSLHGKGLAALSYCCMTTYKSQELTDLSLQCCALIKQFLKFLGNYSKKLQLRIASNICGALEISSIFSYDNLGLEVSLYKRSTAWFGCGWMFLPSFGRLLVLFALFFSSFLPLGFQKQLRRMPGQPVLSIVSRSTSTGVHHGSKQAVPSTLSNDSLRYGKFQGLLVVFIIGPYSSLFSLPINLSFVFLTTRTPSRNSYAPLYRRE